MHLIDSHCHLDFEQFDSDREQLLGRCQQLGISKLIVPGVQASRWERLIHICGQSALLFPAIGLHPLFMEQHSNSDLLALTELLKQYPIVAIGEIGLDFYLKDHDKQGQIDLFCQQLELAQQHNLPVLLHIRKAHDHALSILKKYPVSGGIVHAFNGSLQQAEQYQKLGFHFGIGGAITHPRATRLRALVSALPLASLVLETDSPDMPLYAVESDRNSPENIPLILATLSELRQESMEEIARVTTHNCMELMTL